jgi:hypothetical protein
MVRFAIDECSVDFDGLAVADVRSALRAFLEQITAIQADGHGVCYDEELFCRALRGGATFWDLFSPDSELQLDHEDCERAAAVFGAMTRWYELPPPQPTEVDVRVDGGPAETTGSVAWAHAQADRDLSAAACLSIAHGRPLGLHKVSAGGVDRYVWFVGCQKGTEKYFRYLLEKHAQKPDDFADLASYAFPELRFVDGCFDGIRSMSRPCREIAPDIVNHLSAFSDAGRRIFSGPWQRAPAEFGSLHVDISDENGATKSDREAAAQRRRVVDGKAMYFWWHSKIGPDRDRIHISPDEVPAGGKIVIGILCMHLK